MKNRFRKYAATLTAVLFSVSSLFSVAAAAEQEVYTVNETIVSDFAESLPEDDELLLGYFEQKLVESDLFSTRAAVAYSAIGSYRLSGPALEIYNTAKSRIESIASGNEESTVIIFPEKKFTYEQLGLESGASENDIKNAIKQVISKVYKCLLADLPYDFYWHDKSKGMSFGYSCSSNAAAVTFTNLKYSFSPA